MATILDAFWGDETSTRNVTSVLRDMISGDQLKVSKVDDSLIPAFTVTPKGDLTADEVKAIQAKAAKACGSADQACLTSFTSQFTQEALQAKANGDVTSAGAEAIKGKRLTVRIRDARGKITTKVVPENGKLELNGLFPTISNKPTDVFPKMDYITKKVFDLANTALGMFMWVFSVVATYTLFGQMGWKYAAYALTFIAIIVPNSGWFIIFGYFIFRSFLENYKAN